MIDSSFSYSVVFAISNTTLSEGRNANLTDWITAVGSMLSAIVAVGIAGYSFYLTRRNEEKHSLSYVFSQLNDNAHRNARRRIYNLYGENDLRRKKKILKVMGVKVEDLERIDAIQTESAEMVKADFDEIGSLIENKSVPQKEFYNNQILYYIIAHHVAKLPVDKFCQCCGMTFYRPIIVVKVIVISLS